MIKLIQLGKKYLEDQKGAALSLALILFILSAILIVPLLSFIAGGFKTTDRVYDQKSYELYAADAGVRDAIWTMRNSPFAIPQEPGDADFSSSLGLNNKIISYRVAYISQFEDAGGDLLKTYRIDSIASSEDGKNTEIISYAVQPFGENNMVFDYAVASGAGIDFKKDCVVMDGPIGYKNGPKPDDDNVFYDPDSEGVDESLPSANPDLELPSEAANQAFAAHHKKVAQDGGSEGSLTVDAGTLGPVHIDGNLSIEGSVNLSGSVYVAGKIWFDKEGILNGQGVIIAEELIECKKENTLSADPDTRIVFMCLDGDIDLRKGQDGYHAIFYAPKGTISFKKDQTIQGSVIAGEGFVTDKNLNVEYVDDNQESLLPGYIALDPQLQTWDITALAGVRINSGGLPACKVNTNYPNQTLSASGGVPPYTWDINSGSLPTGLALNGSTGGISGTPTTLGTFDFTVTATDSTGKTGFKAFSIIITALNIDTTPPLAAGTAGTAYSQSLSASGGTEPYTWSLKAGSLPLGLTLSGNLISGTPTVPGVSVFTIQVRDSTGNTSSKTFSITIN